MSHIVRRRKVILQNTWKCDSCGAALSGAVMVCNVCGNGKKPSEAYQPPADLQAAPEVTDSASLDLAAAGPNWSCDFCGGQARASNGECLTCGGAKPSAEEAPPKRTPPPPDVRPSTWRRVAPWAAIIGAALLLALVIFLIVRAFRPEKAQATVERTSWERTVVLQQRVINDGSGWKDDAPSGAYGFACDRRKRGERDCNPYRCRPHDEEYDCDPYDCRCSTQRENCYNLENGFEECDEVERCDTCYRTCTKTAYDTCYERCDVIADWCSYRYDTWPEKDRATSVGTGLDAAWPTRLTAQGPDERLKREEKYTVVFIKKTAHGAPELTYRTASYDDYARFIPGDWWALEITHGGTVRPQHVLRAEKE